MKKIIAIWVCMLLISLSACSDNAAHSIPNETTSTETVFVPEKIDTMLQGTWTYVDATVGSTETLQFHDGKFSFTNVLDIAPDKVTHNEGTYEIYDGYIQIYFPSTDFTNTINYSWLGKELVLHKYIDSGVDKENTRVYVKQDSLQKTEATVEPDDFYEENIDEVYYSVSKAWRKLDYSNEAIAQKVYYLDETTENCVMAMMFYADNVIYTRQQAEDYMNIFMDGCFSEQNGYTDGSYTTYTSSVPARHGYYMNSGAEVEVYCFLPSTTSILALSKWHLSGSSSEISDDDFLRVINSLQLPELNVEKDNTNYSGNHAVPNFTNQYGTVDTICAYPGCSRNIASTGDTNCCIDHSNKCLNCSCYIDSDAMYCMACLSGSINGSNETYDYDKGYGYSSPKAGQSFSDYLKEQDPDLYDTITNNYNSAVSNSSNSSKNYDYDKGYGYSAPKQGQSFSDYVKEQDPELYDTLTDIYNSAAGNG